MSIRTNSMKAVPLMLKRVTRVKDTFRKWEIHEFDAELENLTRKLNSIKDLFVKVKTNENELLDTLTDLDGHLRKLDKKSLNQEMECIRKIISECVDKLLPKDVLPIETSDSSGVPPSEKHSYPSSSQHTNESPLQENYEGLGDLDKKCLGSLSVFPKDAVIKTKPAIYWWIGLGYFAGMETEEGVGKGQEVINRLLGKNMIIQYGNGKDPVVKKFKINPFIQDELSMSDDISSCLWLLEQPRAILGGKDHLKPDPDETSFIFNVGASYVNFESQWLATRKNLKMLQLGRWQDSPLHHIEVESEEFLEELKGQKELRYLSLRGISRITELPPSIAQLESLQILDLKACHNLETLPNIASLKSLTHLILSKCYLLDSMPKGIEKLTGLQVFKGFVISSSRKTPSGISDLANLSYLRRLSIHIASEALSIHIASEAVINDREFESLKKLSKLESLKISWACLTKVTVILRSNCLQV